MNAALIFQSIIYTLDTIIHKNKYEFVLESSHWYAYSSRKHGINVRLGQVRFQIRFIALLKLCPDRALIMIIEWKCMKRTFPLFID
jgi:hypothetical protein